MKVLTNAGADRVVDLIGERLTPDSQLDLVTPEVSLFAFSELEPRLAKIRRCRLILPTIDSAHALNGSAEDRVARNRLRLRWLAGRLHQWLGSNVDIRFALSGVPTGLAVVRDQTGTPRLSVHGASFTTAGLGLTPGNLLSFIHASESEDDAIRIGQWFDGKWAELSDDRETLNELSRLLDEMASHRSPELVYAFMLHHLFGERGDALDEEEVIRSATGIHDTVVWKKLFRFQRDGVVGAIDKLNRFGGCIIADSVGLGKTFEALAIIKYHELRNDRVLVLCPKRLRENWTIYKANDRRNILAADRLNYDVLNHTDLSRDHGLSGDVDLAHVNWGNYDLVVIDESHNFRNKKTPRADSETRYDRLMKRIVAQGIKTRVLMLSATPVNNRLADLRNQIAFATEGDDAALGPHGVASIDSTTRLAQKQFNAWLKLPDEDRTPSHLIDMLGFDYFTLLDLLTIARSRKHIEKYYGTDETGRFPERLPPLNIKADVDVSGGFPGIATINDEIKRLKLAAYAPLSYVLPHKQEEYDARYGTTVKGGAGFFKQSQREQSLIHLMRINLLKRMESAVSSFVKTLARQLEDVEAMLARIDEHAPTLEGLDLSDIDIDDPLFESLLVGSKVKVLLSDVDLRRWRQALEEDRRRLQGLLESGRNVDAERDAKLAELRRVIEQKLSTPINADNRKVLVFTAFADTAEYLYEHLATWAKDRGLEAGLVTGSGRYRTTLPRLRKDFSSILSAFAPRAKERPDDLASEGGIELLIATDCISEGQNLQDCDFLVNYDIHWNPVRIIQRFGRIDRIGSVNERIQLVNFWPNMELEEYINLEQRVSGRMVLLDVSATGEENIIDEQSGNQMNDLEYRRKQLLKLQDAVIDLEDLSTGVSITDLTLTDFRIDLARFNRAWPGRLERVPIGTGAVVSARDVDIPPGMIFCLRAQSPTALLAVDAGYPLGRLYFVHIGDEGTVVLPHTQAKQVLDCLKRLCSERSEPEVAACERFDSMSDNGRDMRHAQSLLAAAASSIAGRAAERSLASLFNPGGTHIARGEFAGMNDFEVIAWLAIIDEPDK
jgi:SNF2 family DNA or RNA helicase